MSDKRFRGKVSLVTGSSRGIGRGIALGLAREGSNVIIHYRSRKDSAEEFVECIRQAGSSAAALQADLEEVKTIEDFIDRAWSTFGKIDILVNNAGVVYDVEFLQMPYDTWKKTMTINLDGAMLCGAMLCSQSVAQRMVHDKIHGKIVCITSVNGFQVEKNRLAYNVSKAGLEILVKSMAT
jgi:NAD(P)-dependent dehydrogenase (short-subunit alcohol dehydrogenase family)